MLPTNITLQPGDSGEFVSELQRRLVARDLLPETSVTGFYDGVTTQSVKTFQSQNGIKDDGIAGPETLRLLISFGNTSSGGGGWDGDGDEEKDEGLDRYDDALYMNKTMGREEEEMHGQEGGMKATDQKSAQKRRERAEEQELEREGKIKAEDLALTNEMQMMQEREAEAARDDSQLEVTQEHIKAETPIESISKEPDHDQDKAKELDKDQAKEKEAEAAKASEKELSDQQTKDIQTKMDHENAAQQEAEMREVSTQQAQEAESQQLEAQIDDTEPVKEWEQEESQDQQASGKGQNVEIDAETGQAVVQEEVQEQESKVIRFNASMQRVHNSLSPHAQVDSQSEGRQLYANGVREIDIPPGTRLGELVPTQTPNLAQNRGAGLGM